MGSFWLRRRLPSTKFRCAPEKSGLGFFAPFSWVGSFSGKDPHLAIRAFARFARNHVAAELRLVGDGPMRAELVRLAADLGVSDRIHFCGWLSRDEGLEEMARADVFLFPSGEGGGMVVLEAMAHGLPVVCLDCGGPGEMVTDDCGVRIVVGSVEDTVAKLASALATLASDEILRRRMGAAGVRNIEDRYLWTSRKDRAELWHLAALVRRV